MVGQRIFQVLQPEAGEVLSAAIQGRNPTVAESSARGRRRKILNEIIFLGGKGSRDVLMSVPH